jgi:hypothetical protein
MKKNLLHTFMIFICLGLLSSCGCKRTPEDDLADYLNSRPPAASMPYENPRYIPQALPEHLPFNFEVSEDEELLGSVEDRDHKNGTILLKTDQSANDILEHYKDLLAADDIYSTSESHTYQVFFPPEDDGATFCSDQGFMAILEIFERGDGAGDVRLHYIADQDVIEQTTCGQPILSLEDYVFPSLSAPPNSASIGGGGGGGSPEETITGKGPIAYTMETYIACPDDLEAIYNHYKDQLGEEGWSLIGENAADSSIDSDWDFGYYGTRSWLAHLAVAIDEDPSQYRIELRAISP